MNPDKAEGFTLLEVMVALAIMAGVLLTVLGAVNYHVHAISSERDYTALTLLARHRMAELEQKGAYRKKDEGSFAPARPELKWHSELHPTQFPGLQKLVLRVQNSENKQEVTLVRYVLK